MADTDKKAPAKPAEVKTEKAAQKAIAVPTYVGANPFHEALSQEQYEELKRKTAEQAQKTDKK